MQAGSPAKDPQHPWEDLVLHALNSRAGGGRVEKGGVQGLTGLEVQRSVISGFSERPVS